MTPFHWSPTQTAIFKILVLDVTLKKIDEEARLQPKLHHEG